MITGSVGRRASKTGKTRKRIPNKPSDQLTLTYLLNNVAIEQGGAGGTLATTAIGLTAGIVSQSLYTAILYFQSKNFPNQVDGMISPGGTHLRQLKKLMTTSPAAASKPLEWTDALATDTIIRAYNKAWQDDSQISLDEAVDIIAAALMDGEVDSREASDLGVIGDGSRSASVAAKHMLSSFRDVYNAGLVYNTNSFKFQTDAHVAAAETVLEFLRTRGTSGFSGLNRYEVGVGLLIRLGAPDSIYQGDASLCGPSTFLSSLARDDPRAYVRYALQLYTHGSAVLGSLKVTPSGACRSYTPPPGTIAHVDWLTAASLRDSENWFFDYSDVKDTFSGITLPDELRSWFRRAGYTDTRNETNMTYTSNEDSLAEASALWGKGYRVCLFVNGDVAKAGDQNSISLMPDHWIGLRSKVETTDGLVKATVYTWGSGMHTIPENASKPLSLAMFILHYYGYVAARPLNA